MLERAGQGLRVQKVLTCALPLRTAPGSTQRATEAAGRKSRKTGQKQGQNSVVLRENLTSLAFSLSLCNSGHDTLNSAELPSSMPRSLGSFSDSECCHGRTKIAAEFGAWPRQGPALPLTLGGVLRDAVGSLEGQPLCTYLQLHRPCR